MLGGGIHMIDLTLWITGERPVDVVAYGSDVATRATGFTGNDFVAALLRFDSGLVAKVSANFASVHPHFHRFLAYGTKATFENAPDGPDPACASGRLWTSRDPAMPPTAVDAAYLGIDKGALIPSFIVSYTCRAVSCGWHGHQLTLAVCGEGDARLQVFAREVGEVVEDFFLGHVRGEIL